MRILGDIQSSTAQAVRHLRCSYNLTGVQRHLFLLQDCNTRGAQGWIFKRTGGPFSTYRVFWIDDSAQAPNSHTDVEQEHGSNRIMVL